MRQTQLFAEHNKLGAKMVEFAGWNMPIQYSGVREEHTATRSKAGLFDVSHMGEIRVTGDDALESLQWLTTNDVSRLEVGQAQYTLFPNADGGIVDDLIVYCLEKGTDYLLCVNASNTDKDFEFLKSNHKGKAEISNVSDQWSQLALQGPLAMGILEATFGAEVAALKPFHFCKANFEGVEVIVARTGYTGEDGAEVFVPNAQAELLWQSFMKHEGVSPVGLAARDTLRLEMKYPLYGQELGDRTSPYEAGLGWVVKPKAKDFLGASVMVDYKEQGLKSRLVGLELTGRGIARQGYKVFSFDNQCIGEVTSGTQSPSLSKSIAIAYVDAGSKEIGTKLQVEIRGKMVPVNVVKTPFV